jgi:uncharacterized repeat protein (TIGR01451 family)
MWRAAPSWAEALLVGAYVATVMLVLVDAANAQPTGSTHLSVTKTGKPRVVTGENQIFTIKVTNQRGDTARDVVMRNLLPDEVSQIPAGPVAELASVERSAASRLFSLEQVAFIAVGQVHG